MLGHETFRGGQIRANGGLIAAASPFDRRVAAVVEDEVHGGSIDSLQAEFVADGPLAPRACAVTRLHPRPRELLVVEHPELGQARDGGIDKVRPVAGLTQATSDLRDGP